MNVATEKDGFVRALVARGRSPATVRLYCTMLYPFAVFLAHQGRADLRAVRRRDVDAYAAELAASSLSEATRSLRLRAVKRLFEHLVETQKLLCSPAEHLRERRVRSLPGKVLSEAQVEKLLAAPNTSLPMGVRDRALLELLYATGLRRKELCGLGVHDVDLAGGLLRVRGKGGHERIVPLSRQAQRWIREYLREVRPKLARRGDFVRALFLTRSGRALDPGTAAQILLRHSKAAGLPRVSCHTLRRTVGTLLVQGGADVRTVAELLGHVRLATTERYTLLAAKDVRAEHRRTHPRAGGGDGRPPTPR